MLNILARWAKGVAVLAAVTFVSGGAAAIAAPPPTPPTTAPPPGKGYVARVGVEYQTCPVDLAAPKEARCDPIGAPTYTSHEVWERDPKSPADKPKGTKRAKVKTEQTIGEPGVVTQANVDEPRGSEFNVKMPQPSMFTAPPTDKPPAAPGEFSTQAYEHTGPQYVGRGTGWLHVWTDWCGYGGIGACYQVHQSVHWKWGTWGNSPVGWVFGWDHPEPESYQWPGPFSGYTYQYGGAMFGLPKYFYNWNGWGEHTGYYTMKKHIVHVCVLNIGCGGDYYPGARMYVHGNGTFYAVWWSR